MHIWIRDGFQRLVTITSSSLLAVIWYLESSSGKSMTASLHEHMLVGDWVWGIQHWQMSLSLALAPSLCRMHLTIISSIFLNIPLTSLAKSLIASLPNEERLPPLKPARKTAASSVISWCCHLRHYAPLILAGPQVSKIALQYHNTIRKNYFCPARNKLKSIQAAVKLHLLWTSDRILKFSYLMHRTQCLCHSLLSAIAPLGTHPLSRDSSWCYTRNHRRSILVTTEDVLTSQLYLLPQGCRPGVKPPRHLRHRAKHNDIPPLFMIQQWGVS